MALRRCGELARRSTLYGRMRSQLSQVLPPHALRSQTGLLCGVVMSHRDARGGARPPQRPAVSPLCTPEARRKRIQTAPIVGRAKPLQMCARSGPTRLPLPPTRSPAGSASTRREGCGTARCARSCNGLQRFLPARPPTGCASAGTHPVSVNTAPGRVVSRTTLLVRRAFGPADPAPATTGPRDACHYRPTAAGAPSPAQGPAHRYRPTTTGRVARRRPAHPRGCGHPACGRGWRGGTSRC